MIYYCFHITIAIYDTVLLSMIHTPSDAEPSGYCRNSSSSMRLFLTERWQIYYHRGPKALLSATLRGTDFRVWMGVVQDNASNIRNAKHVDLYYVPTLIDHSIRYSVGTCIPVFLVSFSSPKSLSSFSRPK